MRIWFLFLLIFTGCATQPKKNMEVKCTIEEECEEPPIHKGCGLQLLSE